MNSRKNLIICRCEEVTEEEIREAIRAGAKSVDAVKRRTRAGMGLCQAKTCYQLVAKIISEETKKPLAEITPSTVRSPIRPISVKLLCRRIKEISEINEEKTS